MKNKILMGIILFFGIIVLYSTSSEATFKITNFEINCDVQENGNIEIEENITYYTNENKNGLIRTIKTENNLNSVNSANSLRLKNVLADGEIYQKRYSANVGQSGVYTFKQSEDTYEIKVFSPFTSNTKTISYKYELTNVIVKYNDIAELYWNFIGSEWDCSIEELTINISLPVATTNGTIYVFGHGSDNGTFTKSRNFITLNAYDLKAYQAVDARILFPTTAVPTSIKTVDKDVLDDYIDQEEGMYAKREEPKVIFGLSVKQIALTLSGIIIIIGLIIYFKHDKEYKVEKYKYYREIPYNLEPEILQKIYYGKIKTNAFWITFLNLIKKGVFRLEKTTNEVGKETEKIILQDDRKVLKPHQEVVKEQIKDFFQSGSNEIDMLKLQAKMKISKQRNYLKFRKELNSETEGIFGETKKVPKKLITMLAISMIALIAFIAILSIITGFIEVSFGIVMSLGITAVVYSVCFATITFNIFTTIFFIFHFGGFQVGNIVMLSQVKLGIMYIPYILLFILIQYVVRVKRSSKEERTIKEQIRGLRRYIKDYSLLSKREEINEIVLWEDYFILAIALGLNKKVINNWYEYGQNYVGSSNLETSLYNIGGYTYMSAVMMPAFHSYAHMSLQSYSSSGSRFSGSSGGFSGGSSSGGGGRRWRRRKFLLKYNRNWSQNLIPIFVYFIV